MYTDYLSFLGYVVAEASTGTEAVTKATALRPDLIVMDLALPGIDGCEATRRLKKDERTRSIPVIAVTGYVVSWYRERAIAAGCDAFLTKPCLPDELIVEVQRLLDGPGP